MPPLDFSNSQFVQKSERYWFYGIILTSIGYGINLVLVVACVNLLYRRVFVKGESSTIDRTRYLWDIFSLGYTLVMFGFATASMVLEVIIEERAFVEFRKLSGGPSFYLYDNVFGRITTLETGYIILIVCHCCAAGLLVSCGDFLFALSPVLIDEIMFIYRHGVVWSFIDLR